MNKPLTEDKANEIKESRVWRHVTEEINFRIDLLMNELRHCDSDDLFYLQTKVQMLEEIKRLPEDVVDRETLSVSD